MTHPVPTPTQEAPLKPRSRSSQWKRAVFLIVRLVIGLALLFAAFRRITWDEVIPTMSAVSPPWLLAGLATVLLSTGLRILRWQMLLKNYQVESSGWNVTAAYLIGQAANSLLPFRGGEIVRFSWLRLRSREGSVPMVVSIAVEKYLDLLMLLLFFIWVIPYLPLAVVQANLAALLAACAGLTMVITAGAFYGRSLGRWLGQQVAGRIPAARRYVNPLVGWLEDSAWMQSPRRFAPAIGLSLAAWIIMAVTNQCVLHAVGLNGDWRASVLVLVLVYVGVIPAFAPGNIGPFHFFAMLALSLVGVSGSQNAAFALFLHLLVTLPPILLSAILILASGRERKQRQAGEHD